MCILSAFDANVNISEEGLLNEHELAVGDDEVIIPVGGRVSSVASFSGKSAGPQIVIDPKFDDIRSILDLPNPDFEELRSPRTCEPVLAYPQEGFDDPLGVMPLDNSPRDHMTESDWLLDVCRKDSYERQRADVGQQSQHIKAVGIKDPLNPKPYAAKPSKLKPPTTKSSFFRPKITSPRAKEEEGQLGEHIVSHHDSPMTARLRYLEANPDLAFSASCKLSNETSNDAKKTKKSSLERHYELWGTSRLPSLNEKKF